jgi:hypothetical protein
VNALGGGCGAASFSFIRTVTVGPGIAPGLLTSPTRGSARGLSGRSRITAGGDFHPALRTSARIKRQIAIFVKGGGPGRGQILTARERGREKMKTLPRTGPGSTQILPP